MADNPYFQLQIARVPNARATLADYDYAEDYPALWLARNRARVLIEGNPKARDHIRLARVIPIDDAALD